jgi:hypothetical protein
VIRGRIQSVCCRLTSFHIIGAGCRMTRSVDPGIHLPAQGNQLLIAWRTRIDFQSPRLPFLLNYHRPHQILQQWQASTGRVCLPHLRVLNPLCLPAKHFSPQPNQVTPLRLICSERKKLPSSSTDTLTYPATNDNFIGLPL